MIWKLLILISILPIAIAFIARWWFGIRILSTHGKRMCRCDLSNTFIPLNSASNIQRAQETASEFGQRIYINTIIEWKKIDPKTAASRESSKRFGMAVPPLSGIIAIFALIVAKVPVMGAVAIFLAAVAISCAITILSFASELKIISIAVRKLRETKSFPNRDDEDAVIRCTIAHGWKGTVPPILTLLQK